MQVFTELRPNVATIVAPANPSRQLAVVINYGGNDVFLGSMVDTGTVVKRNGGSAAIATSGVVIAIQPGPGIQQVCVYDSDAPSAQNVAGVPSGGGGSGDILPSWLQVVEWEWEPVDVTQDEDTPLPFPIVQGDVFLAIPLRVTAYANIANDAVVQFARRSGTSLGGGFSLASGNIGGAPYIDMIPSSGSPWLVWSDNQPYLIYTAGSTGSDGVLAITFRFIFVHFSASWADN